MFSLAPWLLSKRGLKLQTNSRGLSGLCTQGTFEKRELLFVVTAHGAQRLHRAISHINSASAWPEAARADWESVKRPQTPVYQGPGHKERGTVG